jgi:hypothetical protein
MEFALGFERESDGFPQAIEDDGKGAFGHLARVEQFESPCGGISWVREKGLTFFYAGLVEGGEGGFGKINFTAKFDAGREIGNREGKIANGFEIFGDVVAFFPVTPGQTKSEVAVFVTNAYGQAIHFGFDGKLSRLAVKIFFNTIEKFCQFLFAVGVVEALHPHRVCDGAKGVEWGTPDLAGGRVFVSQFGVIGFEIDQFAVEAIVGGI